MSGSIPTCELAKGSRPLGLDDYNGSSDRLKIVCDHYLDLGLGLREANDRVVIWPCPSCGRASFEARFDDGVAGCAEQSCKAHRSMTLTELVAYLDEDVPADDTRRAHARFSDIFEAAVVRERERESQRRERASPRRKTPSRARGGEQDSSKDQLF